MKTYIDLIKELVDRKHLKTPRIIEAFKEVNRAEFMGESERGRAGVDRAFPLPYGQTISQPSTVAFMLEQLQPERGEKVLDVGCGSGWTTALLANVVGEKGSVHGTEIVEELVDFGRNNVRKYPYDNWEIHQARQDKLGLPKIAPFDKILVSAAADELQKELIHQMADGGIMVIPVKNEIQRVERRGNEIDVRPFPGFAFVPLIT